MKNAPSAMKANSTGWLSVTDCFRSTAEKAMKMASVITSSMVLRSATEQTRKP